MAEAEREVAVARHPHFWVRMGGLTRCGKCGAWLTPINQVTACTDADSRGEALLRALAPTAETGARDAQT